MLQRSPGAGDLVEGLALVSRVAANSLDQVRDQIGAPLQLHVDVGPARVDLLAQSDESVVAVDENDEQEDDDADEDPEPEHG